MVIQKKIRLFPGKFVDKRGGGGMLAKEACQKIMFYYSVYGRVRGRGFLIARCVRKLIFIFPGDIFAI